MMITTILLVVALVSFIVAMADVPPLPATRCIALGLALVVLAQLLGGR